MFTTAITPTEQMFKIPPIWIPNPPKWSIFYDTWSRASFNLYFVNTVKITFLSIIGRILRCSLVAYSFARMRWLGREFFFVLTLSTMMLPFQVLMIPQFLIFKSWGWINTHLPLWVPSFASNAFFIFLMR